MPIDDKITMAMATGVAIAIPGLATWVWSAAGIHQAANILEQLKVDAEREVLQLPPTDSMWSEGVKKVFKLCGTKILPKNMCKKRHRKRHKVACKSLISAMSVVIGLGMAFLPIMRLFVMIYLGQMIMFMARVALIVYCMYLSLAYSIPNFLSNMHILSETIICGEFKIVNATVNLINEAIAPMKSKLNEMKWLTDALNYYANMIIDAFKKIRDIINEVFDAIKKAVAWLTDLINNCEGHFGSPLQKCYDVFNDGKQRCRVKLTWLWNWLCEIVEACKWICCSVLQIVKLACIVTNTLVSIVDSISRSSLGISVSGMINLFGFEIRWAYEYFYFAQQSKSYTAVVLGIVNEISARTGWIFQMIFSVRFLAISYLLWNGYKVLWYRHKWLHQDPFDNTYLHPIMFQKFDAKREATGRPCVFPLTRPEKRWYYSPWQVSQTRWDLLNIFFTFYATYTEFTLITIYSILPDLLLYYLLLTVQTLGDIPVPDIATPLLKLDVTGDGILSNIFRQLCTVFTPQANSTLSMSFHECLPKPRSPNFYIYKVMVILHVVNCVLLIVSAYLRRLPNGVCVSFYPERAVQRATWLYNHILRRRGPKIKDCFTAIYYQFAGKKEFRFTLIDVIAAKITPLENCLYYFGRRTSYCYACALQMYESNAHFFIRCQTYACKGLYCRNCFQDLQKICPMCNRIVSFDDVDLTPEEDSSADELDTRRPVTLKQLRRETDAKRFSKFRQKVAQTQAARRFRQPFGFRPPFRHPFQPPFRPPFQMPFRPPFQPQHPVVIQPRPSPPVEQHKELEQVVVEPQRRHSMMDFHVPSVQSIRLPSAHVIRPRDVSPHLTPASSMHPLSVAGLRPTIPASTSQFQMHPLSATGLKPTIPASGSRFQMHPLSATGLKPTIPTSVSRFPVHLLSTTDIRPTVPSSVSHFRIPSVIRLPYGVPPPARMILPIPPGVKPPRVIPAMPGVLHPPSIINIPAIPPPPHVINLPTGYPAPAVLRPVSARTGRPVLPVASVLQPPPVILVSPRMRFMGIRPLFHPLQYPQQSMLQTTQPVQKLPPRPTQLTDENMCWVMADDGSEEWIKTACKDEREKQRQACAAKKKSKK